MLSIDIQKYLTEILIRFLINFKKPGIESHLTAYTFLIDLLTDAAFDSTLSAVLTR